MEKLHLLLTHNKEHQKVFPNVPVTTEASQESFKIQSGPLTCDSEKIIYLLISKVCSEVPYVGKAKTKFRYRFNNYKSKHRAFRNGNQKVPEKLFHTHYCLDGHSGIEDWDFVIFEQCETHSPFVFII